MISYSISNTQRTVLASQQWMRLGGNLAFDCVMFFSSLQINLIEEEEEKLMVKEQKELFDHLLHHDSGQSEEKKRRRRRRGKEQEQGAEEFVC